MKITGIYGKWYDHVLVDGQVLSPGQSQNVYNHSPDGFSWGYGGSGPTQLALAILLKAGIPAKDAMTLHQLFKWEFIAKQPERGNFTLELDVVAWADQQLRRSASAVFQSNTVSEEGNDK